MNENTEFKPYIPAEKVTPELTVTSVIMGCILAVIFGAANAYLGLRVGMTVSASIPAAVISMGVIRVLLRRNSILESNMVQTIGSAGESLAAGAIFTMPALFLWAEEGLSDKPGIVEITLIALCGGILGVLFMVPLRNALIVKEHATLLYPEGTACADVLLAGEEGGANASTVFSGMGLAAIFKFVVDGLKLLPADVAAAFKSFKGEIGMEVYPALLGVGYIVGPKIASYMFVGSLMGWMVIIPMICLFGPDTWMYPAAEGTTIAQLYANGGAAAIWSTYVKYIGAGAIATGGIISLIKSLPLIVTTFRDSMKSMKGSKSTSTARTAQDLPMQFILLGVFAMVFIIWIVPAIPVTLLGAFIIVIFGFFFATVSSRMVGLVGSSNNPVSGMAIATLLIATFAIKSSGKTGIDGMTAAIAVGSVICIIAAIAGDTSQDLKTGYLLGATPKKQQMGEMLGVVVSGLAIGGVLYLLNAAWGYGTAEIPAPQAQLMKMIVEGIMGGNLPWGLVFIGVFLAICLEILRIPVMPFAIGLYLPIYLNATIMIGGVVRGLLDRRKGVDEKTKTAQSTDGTLYCAGMIAGEGVKDKNLGIIADPSYENLCRFVMEYADGVVAASAEVDPRVLEIVRESGKPMLEYQSPDAEDFFDNYNRFYEAIQ